MRTWIVVVLAGLMAACSSQQPTEPSIEMRPGDAEEYRPGADGDVHTVTWTDPDGEPVTFSYEVIDGLAIFEGDMILGTAEEFEAFEGADGIELTPQGSALYERVCWRFVGDLACKHYRWPDGLVRYTFLFDWGDGAANSMMTTRIRDAMDEIEAVTAVRFVPRTQTSQSNYIRFGNSDGCSANVGRQGGQQNVNLSTGCGKFVVVHELLHALGINHEQTRHDRDDFVTVFENNIRSGKKHNFERSDTAFDLGGYDYESLMHYGARAFCRMGDDGTCVGDTIRTKPPGIAIGQRSSLSDGDIAAIHRLYPGPDPDFAILSPEDGVTRQLNFPIVIRTTAEVPAHVPGCCTYSWTIDGATVTDHREPPRRNFDLTHTFTTEGLHEVRMTARTGTGAESSASVEINVVNTPPTVTINNPVPGAALLRDASVILRATSFDPNEPGTALACERLEWISSVASDPFPATGCEVETSFASNGARTLTVTGADPQGAVGTAGVAITVVEPPENLPPTVRINSPTHGDQVGPDQLVALAGEASDPEGGDPLAFKWSVTYEREGAPTTVEIGNGPTLDWRPADTIPFAGCDVNEFVDLSLDVSDPGGSTGSDAIEILVQRIC